MTWLGKTIYIYRLSVYIVYILTSTHLDLTSLRFCDSVHRANVAPFLRPSFSNGATSAAPPVEPSLIKGSESKKVRAACRGAGLHTNHLLGKGQE